MSARGLAALLAGYALALVVACLALEWSLHVSRSGAARTTIVSIWTGGARTARRIVTDHPELALLREGHADGVTRVAEQVLDEAPVLSLSPFLFAMSFVPARDGVRVDYDGRSAWLTPDDLLKIGAYNASLPVGELKIKFGVDAPVVFAALARELHVDVDELRAHGRFRRFSVRRIVPELSNDPVPVTRETLRASVIAAGRYLANAVERDGKFRYEIDAATGEASPDYNLPRHSGATWFLAEAAGYSRDRRMQRSVRRAAARLRDEYLVDCGTRRCITDGARADLGSSALALLAFVELVQNGVAPEFMEQVEQLSEFLRSQQRPDGEFKHLYDREAKQAIDVQFLYYTGEAAFALSRAHRVTHDPRDLDAARRALARLVEHPFYYVGWRYYWNAEHWTCHAVDDLWDRAPDRDALEFCLDWMEFVRTTSVNGREASPEYDGASTSGPFVAPQLVVSATRMEAAVATLSAARRAQIAPRRLEALEAGIRQTLAFLMRFQLTPGPYHLMVDPKAMYGGFPASETDLKVRIDYPQHAATGLLQYEQLLRNAP